MAAGDTSDTSDTETSSVAEESDIEADDMPPLFESSDDSDQEVTDGTDPKITVSANQKASQIKKAAANFAKLSRCQFVFADESTQRLKQPNNNPNLDDLAPAHSSVGCVA